MDLVIPLIEGQVHVYYDQGSGTYQEIARGPSVTLHHDHLVADLNGLRGLSGRDRERILTIRSELTDQHAARRALIERTRTRITAPLGPDQRIIRLRALLNDVDMSVNRIAARMSRLAELENPFEARRANDPVATMRLLQGTPYETMLSPLIAERDRIENEHTTLLNTHYPYLTRIATPQIASRLLTLAGSIKSLASAPASRIQLLGAETALFRHLRNPKQKPPKHGVIHEHPLMQRVDKKMRGRLARIIADKIAIAARVDYFGTAAPKDIEATWNALETATRSVRKPRRA